MTLVGQTSEGDQELVPRSAVGAARGLHEGRVTLLTTPCVGATFLAGPLGRLADADLGVRFAVREDPHPDVDRRFLDDGVALAVLPAFVVRSAPGLRERILWEEPVRAVVPAGHRLADLSGPVGLADPGEFVVAGLSWTPVVVELARGRQCWLRPRGPPGPHTTNPPAPGRGRAGRVERAGGFAQARLSRVLADHPRPPRIGSVLHPSPASPIANRGWAEQAERQLAALGVPLPASPMPADGGARPAPADAAFRA